MGDFWETLLACENEGHSFIHDNEWQLDSYDVRVIIHPESHSLDVEGSADGVVLADREALRFLLGLNVGRPDKSSCDIDYLSLNGTRCTPERNAFMFSLYPSSRLPKGSTVHLEFRYHIEPLARKCWVNSQPDGFVPGLGEGETELCFEGLWLPFANDQFQAVTATIQLACPRELTLIVNGTHTGESPSPLGSLRSYRMPLPNFPVVLAGAFEVVESRQAENNGVTFYHQEGYAAVAEQVVKRAMLVRRKLAEWLGLDPPGSFSLVQLKRTSFGQYAPFPLVLFPHQDFAREPEALDLRRLTSMLAHEIGHFWFGGLLRDRPNEQWLSEGFAQYLNLCILEDLYGPADLAIELEQYVAKIAESDWHLHPPLSDIPFSEPLQPVLVRGKAALVLHLLRQEIGAERMHAAMAALVREHAGKPITTREAETTWSNHIAGFDVHGFFRKHIWRASGFTWIPSEKRIGVSETAAPLR